MKTCWRCGVAKPLEGFHRHRERADGRQTECKDCKKVYNRDYYEAEGHRHRDLRRDQRSQLREEVANIIRDAKSQPCVDCHRVLPPVAMDLDHVRGEKLADANRMRSRMGRQMVRHEIAKCDVVCANCHRQRTIERLRRDPLLRAYRWK